MRPVYRITVNGSDITQKINERLIELRVDDNAGVANDALALTMDGKKPHLEIPPKGAIIEVEMGYLKLDRMDQPVPLSYLGSFIYDEVEIEKSKMGGTTVTLNGHAVDSADPWKEPRTYSYHDSTLKKVMEEMIARHPGYSLSIEEELGAIPIRNYEQNAVSDLASVQRLGLKYGGNVKVFDKVVYVARPGTVQRFADTIREEDCSRFFWLTQGRTAHKAVHARAYDKDSGKMGIAKVDTREPGARAIYELPKVYPTIEEAQEAATAQATALAKSRDSFSFTLFHGNPLLISEMLVKLGDGFYAEMPKTWNVVKVTHTFTKGGGFVTEAQCELPRRDGADQE